MSVHDANYTKIKKELGILADEPVFVLRAQDKLALPTIQRYINHARNIEDPTLMPGDDWFVEMQEVLRQFDDWAQENSAKLKVPD